MFEVDGRQVLIDYFHNLEGLEAMADFVQRLAPSHTVAVIAISGDRTNDHITAFGRLAARTFDELIIRDPLPKFLRGRKPGEVSALLMAAAIAEGLSPDKISLADDEREAADMAIAKGGNGSLVVLRANDATALWNYLTQRQPTEAAV